MHGTLFKWTNYISGWQPRWFVLESGILSYYLSQEEVKNGSRGSFKVAMCNIKAHPSDPLQIMLTSKSGAYLYVKASTLEDRQKWLVALGIAKQSEGSWIVEQTDGEDMEMDMRKNMAALRQTCNVLVEQISTVKKTCSNPSSVDVKILEKSCLEVQVTCDTFVKNLADCMAVEDYIRTHIPLKRTTSKSEDGQSKHKTVQSVPTDLFYPNSSSPMSPTSPLTSLSSPSRARANQSNQKHPPRLTVESAEPRTVQSNAAGGGSRHGIPAHLKAHPTHPGHSMALQTSSTPNNVHHVFEHSATVFQDSTQIAVAVETTNHYHFSRSGSEAFITPESSPRDSTVGTPTEDDMPPDTPPGDTPFEDTHPRPLLKVSKSLFSKVSKFDFPLESNEGIPTEQFLEASKGVVVFLDSLNSSTVTPIRADVDGNITKLSNKFKSNPSSLVTLQAMIKFELDTNTHQESESATTALLWLRRTLDFAAAFAGDIAGGEQDLIVSAGKAYTDTLRPHHNWIVRGLFNLACQILPYRKDAIIMLGGGDEDSDYDEIEESVCKELNAWSENVNRLSTILRSFYHAHDLDT